MLLRFSRGEISAEVYRIARADRGRAVNAGSVSRDIAGGDAPVNDNRIVRVRIDTVVVVDEKACFAQAPFRKADLDPDGSSADPGVKGGLS